MATFTESVLKICLVSMNMRGEKPKIAVLFSKERKLAKSKENRKTELTCRILALACSVAGLSNRGLRKRASGAQILPDTFPPRCAIATCNSRPRLWAQMIQCHLDRSHHVPLGSEMRLFVKMVSQIAVRLPPCSATARLSPWIAGCHPPWERNLPTAHFPAPLSYKWHSMSFGLENYAF